MREIKFRAWDKKQNKMNLVKMLHFSMINETEHVLSAVNFLFRGATITPSEVILMQYTGLKDKNGKEIYEGDVVAQGLLTLPIHVEEFHGYRFMWGKDNLTKAVGVYGEIIGNIYENPELLKG